MIRTIPQSGRARGPAGEGRHVGVLRALRSCLPRRRHRRVAFPVRTSIWSPATWPSRTSRRRSVLRPSRARGDDLPIRHGLDRALRRGYTRAVASPARGRSLGAASGALNRGTSRQLPGTRHTESMADDRAAPFPVFVAQTRPAVHYGKYLSDLSLLKYAPPSPTRSRPRPDRSEPCEQSTASTEHRNSFDLGSRRCVLFRAHPSVGLSTVDSARRAE